MTGVFNENTSISKGQNAINNVCMIRSVSKNNRFYTPEALDSLVKLGKRGGPIKAFIDHDTLFQGQSVLKMLGEFNNLRRLDDAVYADLTVYESSPGKNLLFDIAENHPHAAGFSINARGLFEEEPDKTGREVVKEIVAIRSCDFVGEPATTFGVFEQDELEKTADQMLEDQLPDTAFAYVDSDGKRHLPYRDADMRVDLTKLKIAIDKVKDLAVDDEFKEQLKVFLLGILEQETEIPIGEPYTMQNPPAAVKNLPKGAQRIFITVFNSTYASSKDENKARQAAWGAVKNKYKRTASGTWVRASQGGETMENVIKFLESHVQGWSNLTEDAQEEAALEYLNGLVEKCDEVGELGNTISKLEETKSELAKKVEEVSSQLAEAQAKVDAYETKEKEAEAKKTRIELITKITTEEELAEENISETFRNILMKVAEGEDTEAQIRDLVKDRKSLLGTPEGGVSDMGHESTSEGEDPPKAKEADSNEKKKEKFFKELEKGL
jgi:cation transport regulator ChaB